MATVTQPTINKTIFGKLQTVRAELSKLNLKKSGKNKFTGNTYYELGDFEPQLNGLCDKNGIMPQFLLENEKVKLWIIDTEKPEDRILFFIPTVPAEVKGALAIQNLGAQITYLRRYSLMIAFQISEGETIEQQAPQDKAQGAKTLTAIHIDEINAATTPKGLIEVCGKIKKQLGKEYEKVILVEYTRRKKEIEAKQNDVPEIPTGEEASGESK